jgi:hypothetical protein
MSDVLTLLKETIYSETPTTQFPQRSSLNELPILLGFGILMGHVWVDVKLINPITGQDVKLTALVDTGPTSNNRLVNFEIVPR